MYRFLPGRLSPSIMSNISAVAAASEGITRISLRDAGFIVVFAIMSAEFSPSPFDRCKVYFFPAASSRFTISFFSNSLYANSISPLFGVISNSGVSAMYTFPSRRRVGSRR